MTRVALVTDSTCDLPAALVESRSIAVVPLTVTLDGKDYRDGVDITADQFYARLTGSSTTSTSQPSPALFADTYERLLKNYDEVVSLHIAGRLSGTVASAQQAAAEVGRNRVRVVDSEVVSMALGLLCLVAAAVLGEGADATQAIAEVERVRASLRAYFTVGTLEHLRRGGRIGRASEMLGSVLQIKPVLMLSEGEVAPLERVRTRERALARVLDLVRGVDQGQGLCAIVAHAAAEDTAERFARDLDSVTDTLMVQPLGPVVGAHAGPGTVGVACYPAELFRLGLKPSASALLQR
jgi:fatty acid kinase fatty acid binding subunit